LCGSSETNTQEDAMKNEILIYLRGRQVWARGAGSAGGSSRPVAVDGVVFGSLGEAAIAVGTSTANICYFITHRGTYGDHRVRYATLEECLMMKGARRAPHLDGSAPPRRRVRNGKPTAKKPEKKAAHPVTDSVMVSPPVKGSPMVDAARLILDDKALSAEARVAAAAALLGLA
jgi:hypothetical protein